MEQLTDRAAPEPRGRARIRAPSGVTPLIVTSLEVPGRQPYPELVSILTKSLLVLRDSDVLGTLQLVEVGGLLSTSVVSGPAVCEVAVVVRPARAQIRGHALRSGGLRVDRALN